MYLKFAKSTYEVTKIQGWTLALHPYSVLQKLQILPYTNTKIQGGRWRCKPTASMIFAQSTIQRYNNSRLKSLPKNTKKHKGGHWRYKLTVSLTFAKFTIQRYKNSGVDVGLTNLECP